jgi:hypothetical protein
VGLVVASFAKATKIGEMQVVVFSCMDLNGTKHSVLSCIQTEPEKDFTKSSLI